VKIFHCDQCDQLVFFESSRCTRCDRLLAFLPDVGEVSALAPSGDDRWRRATSGGPIGPEYRLCANYRDLDVCNWAVPADDPSPLCASCRLTRVIPDLGVEGNRERWYRVEVAKRRLIVNLCALGLSLTGRSDDPERGIAFELVADAPGGVPPVLTGHSNGVITLSVAEADDAERERRRVSLGEPYRTLLGHVRHESGHYFWPRLVERSDRLAEFRARFGDERTDYAAALARHHGAGAPVDWPKYFVTAYASAHPWEDWAETWAHYLHLTDTLETAAGCGLKLVPRRGNEPSLDGNAVPGTKPPHFDALLEDWFALTYVLNNLNRGLGQPDGYPFVLASPAIDKLRFVHDVIEASATHDGAPIEHG
jgi:hypothetical protein